MNTFLNNLFTRTKWQVIFIAGISVALYFRTLSYDFIGLDEQSLLADKKEFNKKISSIPKAFSQDVFQNETRKSSSSVTKFYRPVLTDTFILDQQFSGDGFTFFRITNILIHIFACIGLLFVLQQLKIPGPISFLFAVLFTVHPLLTQAIAWIPGRNDSLVCAFILWSFYFLIRKPKPNMGLHLLLFALAIFTKENAVAFAILCTYYVFAIEKTAVKNNFLLFGSYATILLVWFFARQHAVAGQSVMANTEGEILHSFLKSAPLLFQYLQKTILPVNLSVMSTVADTNYGWFILALFLLGTALYLTNKLNWTLILFGFLWFFLFFLPTLLFSYFEGMEHRAYLPMAGLLIAFAHTDPVFKLVGDTKRLAGIIASLIIIFGFITFKRIPDFKNELSYWESAYNSSEHSAVVCRDYGIILTKMDNYEKAEKVFLEGIKRDPKTILTHYNLAAMYYKTDHLPEAEVHLKQELSIDSTRNPLTYHLLGLIYARTGRNNEAVQAWNNALRISPGFPPAIHELKKLQTPNS